MTTTQKITISLCFWISVACNFIGKPTQAVYAIALAIYWTLQARP